MKIKSSMIILSLISCLYGDDFDDEFDESFDTKNSSSYVEKNSSLGTDDFDSQFETTSNKKKKNYSLTFDGSLKLRGYTFFRHTDYEGIDNARTQGDSVFELNSKFKKNNYILSGTIFSTIGTEYNTYDYGKVLEEFRDLNQKVPIAGIRELYLLQTNDNYDLIMGKKIFKTGISTIYSPSDVYNTTLSPDPLDPYTIGVWLGEFEYYTENSSYGLVFFPVISSSKTFSQKSRWSGNGKTNQNIQNFVVPDGSEVKQDKTNSVRVLLKYKTTQLIFNNGFDFMLNFGYGPSLYTILQYTNQQNVYLETHPKAFYISTGFSTTYKKLEIHGEAYYQNVRESRDDDFISAVGGASYTLDKWIDKFGFNKATMTLEYVREIVTKSFENSETFRSSQDERAPKNDILIKLDLEINYKWSLNYFANFRLALEQNKDSGRYQKLGTTYMIKDGLVSEIFVEMFNGDENSYYGKWKENDRIGYQLKYSF